MNHTKGKWKIDKTLSINIKSGDVFVLPVKAIMKPMGNMDLISCLETAIHTTTVFSL